VPVYVAPILGVKGHWLDLGVLLKAESQVDQPAVNPGRDGVWVAQDLPDGHARLKLPLARRATVAHFATYGDIYHGAIIARRVRVSIEARQKPT
jgi:hypothetical protein